MALVGQCCCGPQNGVCVADMFLGHVLPLCGALLELLAHHSLTRLLDENPLHGLTCPC